MARFLPVRILDLYALRFLASSYAICFATLVALVLLGDSFDKLDRFFQSNEAWWRAIPRYYAGQLPLIIDRFAPFITLAAVMFTVARLERNNEILPMKAGGVSVFRAMAPLLLASLALGGISVANSELVIPAMADVIRETTRFQKKGTIKPGILRDHAGNTLYAEVFDPARRRLHWVSFREYDERGHEVRVIHAERADWIAKRGRLGFWLLEDGVVHEAVAPDTAASPDGGAPRVAQRAIGRGVPRDREAPRPEEGLPLVTSIRPIDIESLGERVSLLSFSELRDQYRRQSYLKRLHVQIHARIAAPLTHPVLCLLGLPFVLRTGGRKSFFLGLVALLAICAGFFVTNFIFQDLASDGFISPLAGVWTPLGAFALLGIVLFDRVPT